MEILAKVWTNITNHFLPGEGKVERSLYLMAGAAHALDDVDSLTASIWSKVEAVAWESVAKAPGEKILMEIDLTCAETDYSETLRLKFIYDAVNGFNIDLLTCWLEIKDTLRYCLTAQIIKHLMSSK